MLDAVIVVSCERDLAVNLVSIPAVVEFIEAVEYLVIVPQADVKSFRRTLPARANVVAEEQYLGNWNIGRIANTLPNRFCDRANWYLQQFVKISALNQLPCGSEALIWDGDTVPLRSLKFTDESGRIGYYLGSERHTPYFQVIHALLEIKPAIPQSFVAQCICARVQWIRKLLDAIESRSGSPWIDTILRVLPGHSKSEFSEYETIGTFVATHHPDEIFMNHGPWFRWGSGYCGGIDRADKRSLRRLSRLYDFVAFESWDRGPRAWLHSRARILGDILNSLGAWRQRPASSRQSALTQTAER
ncbi:MAG: DUF6492 family protein [Steroidobacteraceae bacterium]